MRQDRAASFFAPTVFAQPCYAHERMACCSRDRGSRFCRKWLLEAAGVIDPGYRWIRVTLIIHVVQQTDCLPKIDIFTAQLREMLHRICHRVAMFSKAFGLDPLVENI